MKYTPKLNLKKPELTDPVNIDDINGNMDLIENEIETHKADYTKQVPYAVATGTANTYAVTLNPAPTVLTEGMALSVRINVASTSTSTLNVNGLGAKSIKKANGTAVTNLKANGIYTMRYDGTNFILQGEGASGDATAFDLLSGKTASTDAGEIIGSIPNRGIFNLGLGVSVPWGYYSGGTTANGKRFASGSFDLSYGQIITVNFSFIPRILTFRINKVFNASLTILQKYFDSIVASEYDAYSGNGGVAYTAPVINDPSNFGAQLMAQYIQIRGSGYQDSNISPIVWYAYE